MDCGLYIWLDIMPAPIGIIIGAAIMPIGAIIVMGAIMVIGFIMPMGFIMPPNWAWAPVEPASRRARVKVRACMV